jgi:hypothetical protein
MKFPGGSKAIDTYYNESLTKKPKKQNFKVLCFDAALDIYTVSFVEAGKRKIEKLLKASELLKLPGGALVIEEYTALYTAKPVSHAVAALVIEANKTKERQVKSRLRAFNFNPDLDSYTLSFNEAGQPKKIEKLMKTGEILELPGGFEAIEKYKKLELARYNSTQPKIVCAFNYNLLLDNYTVKIQIPGETSLIEKQMTTAEILYLPSGAAAIASYNRLSHLAPMNAQVTPITPAGNLSILKFDKVLKNYTVSYTDPGKKANSKKTEQVRTRSELTNMQGVLLVLLNYFFC